MTSRKVPMLNRVLFSLSVFFCLTAVSAQAQNFWLPTAQIKGFDQLPLSSNPVVLTSDTAIYAVNADGIFVSTNHGSDWAVLSPTLRDQGIGIKRIIKAQNGNWLAAPLGLDGTMFSTNSGVTWESSAGLPFLLVQHIALHPEGALFASVREKGVMRSVDHGQSWSAMNSGLPEGFWGEGLIALKNGDLLVGTGFGTTHGVYRSTNKGVSWTEVKSLQTPLVQTFAQDQLGRVFAGTSDLGVFVSTDNGMTWEVTDSTGIGFASVESIAIGNDTSAFISTEGRGVFRLKDAHTWTYTGDGSGGNINQLAVAMDGLVYAGIPQGMVRSKESTGSIIPAGGQGAVKDSRNSDITVSVDATSGRLTFSGLTYVGDYQIFDLLGREVLQGSAETNTLDLSALSRGTYLLLAKKQSFIINK
jgi:hypothetical protein